MFEITLITVGKLKEKFYITAAQEYEKRLKGYCKFQILELPESKLIIRRDLMHRKSKFLIPNKAISS